VPVPTEKNLIFDLGGVILDLSVDHTLQSFSELSGIKKDEVKRIFISRPEFNLYEKGAITDADFRNFVRQVYNIKASDAEIDSSWNAMLRDISLIKLQLLQKLKESYHVYLLSNTNGIHLHYINEVLLPRITGEHLLDVYFHYAYYSHRMKKRKPDADIFQQVLSEQSLKPEETLFLDDNALNVEGANLLGIKTVYITSANHILDIFHA
jgi:putative hydrolase of the HAD superfamily